MSATTIDSDLLAERTELSLGERLSLLSHPHRRGALECLDRASGGVDVEAFADCVVREVADDADEADDERRQVLLALHHNHLPRLEDHGVLEYDPESGIVTAT